MDLKQEVTKKIQDYLNNNDKLFETAGEDEKVESSLVTIATNNKAVYTRKQVAKFAEKFMEYPPKNGDYTLTWYQLPGLSHSTRGWIWQNQDGYFFVKCGGLSAYFIDRRFYQ